MCLAIPAKVIGVDKDYVQVDHGGKRRKASCKLVRPKVGDYVLIQFGFITEILDKETAEKSLNAWREIDGKV
jgi:hydrogenase expression/formation protein HypC